uniref:RPGRIP1 like n=1 Tax=Takifugu rubripes TaxID=31033 RepID=A0A674MG23_TAKRU
SMSNHDETAADVPVRDTAVPMSTLQNARSRQDVSRVSREELEDRFLYLQEENVHLKEHANIQDEKIKKLGTKLMKMVKDRGRLEQLVAGRGQPVSKVRDLEMEEMVEELQEKVQTLQKQNEVLKQRHHASRQQLLSLQSRRAPPYGHIQSRVNSGLKKLHDDASSGSRPKCTFVTTPLTHLCCLLTRENVNELQQNNMKEMERALALLQEELRKKEADYEEKLLLIRQQRTSKVRSHVDSNVTLIKLQKQLADRSNTVTEMEARFLQLQESQKTLKASYDAAVGRVDELLAQLKNEKQKNLELADQLQLSNVANIRAQQLQEQLNDVEQERDLLKESNAKLLNSAFDVSREQKWQIQEQQLRVQISQLERALQADLVDKNEILDRIKAEQERLTEEMKKLKIDCLEKQLQLEELNSRLKLYSREGEFSAAELTEALLLIKAQKKMGFLTEVEEDTNSLRELKAAHAETIQELQKTRKILNMESNICNDYKLELEQLSKKMNSDQARYRQTLEQQTQLLDARAAKINKLEAQLREIAYGAKMYTFQAEVTGEHEADEETVHLEHGENLLELHIIGATLSPSAMELLGECEPSTFCTYTFYKFEMHCTPLVMGDEPKYGFTSKYIVNMDNDFLEYVHRRSVTVELHQKLVGCNWRTVAASQLRLQQLLEHEGKRYVFVFLHGFSLLSGMSNEVPAFGSLHYWFRLKLPMTETIHLYKEKVKAVDYIHSALSQDTQQLSSSRWNELHITVQRCRDLKPRGSQQPSPYVVFRFFKFPDYPTATVHGSFQPHFSDTKSYSVCMDTELDQYLRQELIQFYVFDFKEQELDSYMGKVRIPLLPLAQDQEITGVFELTDDSGHPAGHIEVMLKWKSTYLLPSSSISTTKDGQYFLPGSTFLLTGGRKEEVEQEKEVLHPWQDEEKDETQEEERANGDAVNATPASQSTEEEKDEESQFSEGQLVSTSCQSDDSELSEEIVEVSRVSPQPSERMRVEILSLSLVPEGRVAQDSSVARLFVEYSLLDLHTEETPLSLPKPPRGTNINYNYSKVVPVDAENNSTRRQLLRAVLQGKNPQMERIRFTVVSEPPEEEEDRECEDVGVAFLRIPDILEQQQDLTETSLNILDVTDSSETLGTLTVTVEGLEALQAIMEDEDQDQETPITSLLLLR